MTDITKLASCYEKREPCVIPGGAIFGAEEVYRVFLKKCERFREGSTAGAGKFFLAGQQIIEDLGRYLPLASEPVLSDYLRRLDSEYGGKETLCYGYDFRDQSNAIAEKMSDFLTRFNALITRQPREAFIELFMGKYRMTAGGIHKETAANFQMVLYGQKTMTVWPQNTWDEKKEVAEHIVDKMSGNEEFYLQEIDLESANDVRLDLVGQPGDLLYWPEHWWHVGHSDDFTFSVTMPLYF